MNQHFLEKCQPFAGFVPVNLASATAAGVRFNMRDFGRCAVVFHKGAGNAAEDPTITLLQHDAASGGNSKALNFTRVDKKVGTLTSVGTFTKVTQAAANTYVDSASGDVGMILVIDISVNDLDIDGGFAWISASIGDVGSVSQLGALIYFGHDWRLGTGPVGQHFLEKFQVCAGFGPVNMATAANTGDVVNLSHYGRCAILVHAAAGAVGEPPTLTLQQAQEIAGTPANLNFDRVDTKSGADVTAIEAFTKATNADHDYAMSAGNTQKMIVVDVPVESLNVEGGYNCILASVADVGATSQLGHMLYLLHEPRHQTDPLTSAIV